MGIGVAVRVGVPGGVAVPADGVGVRVAVCVGVAVDAPGVGVTGDPTQEWPNDCRLVTTSERSMPKFEEIAAAVR